MSADAGYEVVHEPGAERFVLRHGAKEVGELNYQRTGDRAALLHTEVEPRLRGRGLARDLVVAAVEWARTEKLTLTPLCSYTRVVLEHGDEYRDVL
jgi:predicted GNAT family acetyltransferase